MLADPECVGELLLVGLAMARSIDLGDPEFASNGTMPMRVIAEQVYGRHYLPSPMLLRSSLEATPILGDVSGMCSGRTGGATTRTWTKVAATGG